MKNWSLMKTLKQRRDELADRYRDEQIYGSMRCCESCEKLARNVFSDKGYGTRSFFSGFDAAVAELMPEIEKLVEALEYYPKAMGCDSIMTDEGDTIHADVSRDALTNFKELMGEQADCLIKALK